MATRPDQDLFDTYRATVRPLFAAICRRTGGDRALAEDIVQETYLRALRAWRSSGLPDSPEAWLRTVARNLLVSHWRRVGREMPAHQGEVGATPADSPIDRMAVRDALDRVGPGRARLLHGFHVEGRTVGEIAADGELSERAVEGRLRRARQALAKILTRTRS